VDKNQHTPVKLLDFVSVMIENKRVDKFDRNSEVIFDNRFVLKFLKYHKEFVERD
jgi:hypothetical protein